MIGGRRVAEGGDDRVHADARHARVRVGARLQADVGRGFRHRWQAVGCLGVLHVE